MAEEAGKGSGFLGLGRRAPQEPPPPKEVISHNRAAVAAWLAKRPKGQIVAFAARCGLRSMVYISSAPTIALPSFQAVASVFVSANNPTDLSVRASTLYAATTAAVSVSRSVTSAPYTSYAVSAAASSAKAASATNPTDMSEDAASAAHASIHASAIFASFKAADTNTSAFPGPAETGTYASHASDDLLDIHKGISPTHLVSRPVWSDFTQTESRSANWRKLRSNLLARSGEHWDVWTDWYDARLRGDLVDWELEKARVVGVTEAEWLAGPAVANAKIKEIIARHRGEVPEASVQETRTQQPELTRAFAPLPPPRPQGLRFTTAEDGRLDTPLTPPPVDPSLIFDLRIEAAEKLESLVTRFRGDNVMDRHCADLRPLAEALRIEDFSPQRLYSRIQSALRLAEADAKSRAAGEIDEVLKRAESEQMKGLTKDLAYLLVKDERLAEVAKDRRGEADRPVLEAELGPANSFLEIAARGEFSTAGANAAIAAVMEDARPDPYTPGPTAISAVETVVATAENIAIGAAEKIQANPDFVRELMDLSRRSTVALEKLAEPEKDRSGVKKAKEMLVGSTLTAVAGLLGLGYLAILQMAAANPLLAGVAQLATLIARALGYLS